MYRAVQKLPSGIENDVALKVLRRDIDPRSQAVQRLHDEGMLLSRLSHPVLLRVYDLVTLEGRAALVTEYVDGEDLTSMVSGLPRRALWEVIGHVASALDAAWSAPIRDGRPLRLVHRDIKPSNIRVDRYGRVKLLDFGIATADVTERMAHTQTGFLVGSPPFMAPERFSADGSGPAADMYALGAVAYEGLTGERLMAGLAVPRIMGMALEADLWDARVAERLQRVSATRAEMALLRSLLAHDFTSRPDARRVVELAEALASDADGAALAAHCRQRSWPEPAVVVGDWEGRQLAETVPAPPPRTVAPWVPAVLTAAVLGPIAIAALLGLGWALWSAGGRSAPLPSEPAVVAAKPEADENPNPDVAPVPSIAEPAPGSVAESLPTPMAASRPRRTSPEPAPIPDQPAPVTAKVGLRVEDGVRVALVRAGERIELPHDAVPVGTYTIEATFADGAAPLQRAGQEVRQGGGTISCDRGLWNCTMTGPG